MNEYLKKGKKSNQGNAGSQSFTNPLYEDPAITEFDSLPEFEDAPEFEDVTEFDNGMEFEDAPEFEDVTVQGRTPLRELQGVLEHSKKGGIHSSAANSNEFNDVTQAITLINTSMDMGKFGGEVADDVQLLVSVENQYINLLNSCNKYLSHHSISRAGRARKAIVRQISDLAHRDIEGLHLASDQIGRASKADRAAMTWDNLLQKARSVKLQINTTFAGGDKATGGAVSDVTKLKGNNAQVIDENGQSKALEGLKFFKPQQKINPEMLAGAMAVDKMLEDNPTMDKMTRAILSRTILDPEAGHYVDTKTGMRPDVSEEIMDAFNPYFTIYDGIKEQLLKPAGLTGVGEIELSGRNVATSRMADLLGVGNLIARSELAEVTDSGGTMQKGIIMDAAKGRDLEAIKAMADANGTKGDYAKSDKNLVAPSFLRDIASLQALDIICGQMDRHGNNMLYQTDDNGRMTGVMGIDNDAAFGTNENAISLSQGKLRSDRAVYDDSDNLVIPHLDKAFAERVEQLSESAIRFAMRGLIGEKETDALILRLNKLKKAIKNATPGQLLEKEEDWDSRVQEEMVNANNTEDEEKALRVKYDAHVKIKELYGVNDPYQLPEGPQRDEAQKCMDDIYDEGAIMQNKAINHGTNYTSILNRI